MLETNTHYFFWRHQFGQWTLRDMHDPDGVIYNCCEQYMMAKKALLFGDTQAYQRIMTSKSPSEQKDLGRMVTSFDAVLWEKHRFGIVWYANYLKFSQHEDLKTRLLNTGTRVIAEASPVDLVWGVGFAVEDEKIHDERNWTGLNLLGKAIMSVRESLKLL